MLTMTAASRAHPLLPAIPRLPAIPLLPAIPHLPLPPLPPLPPLLQPLPPLPPVTPRPPWTAAAVVGWTGWTGSTRWTAVAPAPAVEIMPVGCDARRPQMHARRTRRRSEREGGTGWLPVRQDSGHVGFSLPRDHLALRPSLLPSHFSTPSDSALPPIHHPPASPSPTAPQKRGQSQVAPQKRKVNRRGWVGGDPAVDPHPAPVCRQCLIGGATSFPNATRELGRRADGAWGRGKGEQPSRDSKG